MNKILKVMCFILFALFAGINTIYAQGQSPTGLVVDENGQPMIGVQIKIEGTTVQSPNQKIPDRKTKCVIKTHINIKQNVIFIFRASYRTATLSSA